jgi:hypothetical protein
MFEAQVGGLYPGLASLSNPTVAGERYCGKPTVPPLDTVGLVSKCDRCRVAAASTSAAGGLAAEYTARVHLKDWQIRVVGVLAGAGLLELVSLAFRVLGVAR